MRQLQKRGIINAQTIEQFNDIPHEMIIDAIKRIPDLHEGTKQTYCACYISFTRYLERATRGKFRKALPQKGAGSMSTFFKVYEKCESEALSIAEWHRFIDTLEKQSKRDALIAKCMLQGAKRVSEVLEATRDNIDWDLGCITFFQKKTSGQIRKIVISYPQQFMAELKAYVESTNAHDNYIFVTRRKKQVNRRHVLYAFARAAQKAGIRHVHPHMLRATWVTMANQHKIPIDQIMKITGHCSVSMVQMYDKGDIKDNVSKDFVVI